MDFDKKISFKLPDDAFKRIDEQPDENFYKIPRFVAHIDFGAIDAVTDLYREYLPKTGHILDLMSKPTTRGLGLFNILIIRVLIL